VTSVFSKDSPCGSIQVPEADLGPLEWTTEIVPEERYCPNVGCMDLVPSRHLCFPDLVEPALVDFPQSTSDLFWIRPDGLMDAEVLVCLTFDEFFDDIFCDGVTDASVLFPFLKHAVAHFCAPILMPMAVVILSTTFKLCPRAFALMRRF